MKSRRLELQNVHVLYIFLIPAFILTLLFSYLPMVSNVMAFLDYKITAPFFGLGSEFVGLDNFKKFLSDPKFYEIIGRTLLYSITLMISGFPTPLILALMMNELSSKALKRSIQTISYIPHFVSWVTVGGLIYMFTTVDNTGLVNNIVHFFNPNAERVSYMQDVKNFLPILVISNIWKTAGWGTILYLAGLATIDPQLYEAATVDGAGRWKSLIHITLPGLAPTMCILLIFSLGGIFGTNFDQLINLQNPMIKMDTNTIDMYQYYRGIQGHQYGYSTAIGLFQAIVALMLTLGTNSITKRLSGIGII